MRRILATLLFVLALYMNTHAQGAGEGSHDEGISLKVETPKQTYAAGINFGFTITLHNDGAEKYLYGGEAIGRKRMWTAFECAVTDEKRREIRLALTWGVTVIAGRLDPFALHLGPGETYVLNVVPEDYLFFDYRPAGVNDLAKHLPPGRYRLRCTYKSERRLAQKTLAVWEGDKFVQLWERHPELTPRTWEGEATSNDYSFRVVKSR